MKTKIIALIMSVSLLMSCSTNTGSNNTASISESSNNNEVDLNIKTMSDSLTEYEDNDYYTEWENENPNYINLNSTSAELQGSGATINGSIITINSPGTYVVSGKLEDGQIIVDSDSDKAVKLVLNSAEINSSNNAPIYVKNSGKTIVSLAENTENIITDGSTYTLEDPSTNEPNAAIFSKSDLTLNGTGKLTVNASYNNGINGKDSLKITGGNITVNSVDDGILGNDLIAIKGGNLTIKSTGDSIHSDSLIDISGGTINIESEDDGIHADSEINISGGSIVINKSYEGIEGEVINISNGNIKLNASDDGINVAGGNDSSGENTVENTNDKQNSFSSTGNYNLNIAGGTVYVNASGDGLDANGSIYMTGGTVIVDGPESSGNGALDYDQKFEVTGGTLIASGSSGMAQTPSDTSTQNSVLISYSQVQKSGTIVNLADSNKKNIITFAPSKDYQSVLISSPDLKINSNYTLYTGGTSTGTNNNGFFTDGNYENGTKLTDLTISKSVTSISETGEEVTRNAFMPGQGGHGGKGGGMRPDMKNLPEGEVPQMPNGMPPEVNSEATKNTTDESNIEELPDESV